MKTFYFTVRGDRITSKEEYIFIEGNKGSYEAIFSFGEEWEDMAKMCIVENGDNVYKIPIIGNSCLLPEMQGSSAGIGVIGADALDETLVTRPSTNMKRIGVQDGAANKEVTASLDTAAKVWEKYLSDMETSRKAAEAAKEAAAKAQTEAEESKESASESARICKENSDAAQKSATEANRAKDDAVSAKEDALSAKESAQNAAKNLGEAVSNAAASAENAEKAAGEAESSAKNALGAEERVASIEKEAETRLIGLKADISANLAEVQTEADTAKEAAESAQVCRIRVEDIETVVIGHASDTLDYKESAEKSETAAAQALADLLAMINSGDIILATDGKLPLSSIPATATQEIYTVENEDELTGLTAQRGDLAELIEIVNGERTITKTWQCLGDSSVRENWVVWGTSYAVQSGNATTADNAANANMINNHRMVEMSEEEFAAAVKDENTYYLVY